MTALLILDDQLYTIEALARAAQTLKMEVQKEESIFSFKETAERWASEGRSFATAIDMNLRNITDLDIDELGATREEIGTGEAAGLVVARHVFMNGHDEPMRSALAKVPIAMISAENLKSEARRAIEQIGRERKAETSFVPKPNNAAEAIPKDVSWLGFLERALGMSIGKAKVPSSEGAILQDVTKLLKLNDAEVARLLGFTNGPIDTAMLLSNGTKPLSRDWSDRLHHLFEALTVLLSVYSKSDAQKWIKSPLNILDGASPRELLLSGSMVDLLVVKHLVFDIGHPSN
jgi:uncharacterized protein (DUF2384 family)